MSKVSISEAELLRLQKVERCYTLLLEVIKDEAFSNDSERMYAVDYTVQGIEKGELAC